MHDALTRSIRVARGLEPADLVLKNARIINVFSGDIHAGTVAVASGTVVGIGDYDGRETVDLKGAFLAPGFVEGHIHIESSMLTPIEFARAVIPHGTTTVVADPHELANVLGLEGINFMIEQSLGLPMSIFFMIPSCVPSSHLETSGATLSAREIHYFVNEENVLGPRRGHELPGRAGRRERDSGEAPRDRRQADRRPLPRPPRQGPERLHRGRDQVGPRVRRDRRGEGEAAPRHARDGARGIDGEEPGRPWRRWCASSPTSG